MTSLLSHFSQISVDRTTHSQQINDTLTRIANVGSPILLRRLHVTNAALNRTLIKRSTPLLTQLIHNPQPNLILLDHLLEPFLQHLIFAETSLFEFLRKRRKVRERASANVLLPFARECGVLFSGRDVGGYLCVVVLVVWLKRDDSGGEHGGDTGFNGTDGGLVVPFDGLLGVEVERRSAAIGGGGGDAGGVYDVGQVLSCGAAVVAEVLFVENDAQAAIADFAAGVGDCGTGGCYEGHDVRGAEGIQFAFAVGTESVDVFADAFVGVCQVS